MNIFGTDGIRTTVGTNPLTFDALPKLGFALGTWAQEQYDHAHILLAHDTRPSCSWIKAALKQGLLLHQSTIYDTNILPTPALFHLMKQTSVYTCGIIISASHNPYADNGIKLISQGEKLSEAAEKYISNLMHNCDNQILRYNNFGTDNQFLQAHDSYISIIKTYFQPGMLAGKTIVLDCAYGATYSVAPKIFKALGAQVIALHATADGININNQCGALYPADLQKAVLENKADIGFAFDGDGDRVIAVSRNGVIKDGDDLLALLSNHPDYSSLATIIGTVMTNQGLERYLAATNKSLIRVPVGDKNVVQGLESHSTKLGGEQSGHIILGNIIGTGDGILVALKILEYLIHSQNWDMTTFEKYPQILLNIPVKIKKDLTQSPYADIIHECESKLETGRLLVRYSGTENCLRIMVEESNQPLALSISYYLAKAFEQMLN